MVRVLERATVTMIVAILWMVAIGYPGVYWGHKIHSSIIAHCFEIFLNTVGDHPWKMVDHPGEVGDQIGVNLTRSRFAIRCSLAMLYDYWQHC